MYVLHVRRFANTHFSHVNSSFQFTMKFLTLKELYSCFMHFFAVSHYSSLQSIKKQVVTQDPG